MTKHVFRLLTVALAILGLTLMTGCFKKHIDPSPRPGATPATRAGSVTGSSVPAGATPAVTETRTVTPAKPKKTPGVIEETYVVDAPKEASAAKEQVKEADLGAEAPAAKTEALPGEGKDAVKDGEVKAADPAATAKAVDAAAAPEVMGELYYVQVDAFSELENANKVLAALIEQGYDGSKLDMTESGLFRVQAGGFTDKEAAREALAKLITTHPKAFIVKGTPE